LVVWDSAAQSSSSFAGYRVYRSRTTAGSYLKLREWKPSAGSFLPNHFFDIGDDDADGTITRSEQMRNNVEYFYRISAFTDSAGRSEERFSNTTSASPVLAPRDLSYGAITEVSENGISGSLAKPKFTVTNFGNFDRLHGGHELRVKMTTISTGTSYVFPVTVTDNAYAGSESFILDFSLFSRGDTVSFGVRHGPFVKDNLFGFGALAIVIDWQFEQLPRPIALDTVFVTQQSNDSTDTPLVFRDTIAVPYVGLLSRQKTLGEMEYEVEFLPGGTDTVSVTSRRFFHYLNVRIVERKTGRELESVVPPGSGEIPGYGQWTISRFTFDEATNVHIDSRRAANRYYVPTRIDSNTAFVFSNSFFVEGTRFVCDYADQGRGLGRPWPKVGRKGTRDFSTGDRLRVIVAGGVSGVMPINATHTFQVGFPSRLAVTRSILDSIRIVPNPYIVSHEAQRSPQDRRILFQFLPKECTIRIYSVALDLVKTIHHRGDGSEEWNLRNENGALIASQLFIAHIESSNGISTTKKFAVVTGE
ncbi:MAG: hypothetical protein HY961_04095, partial [Ignavibacteriae bacterium]|nr:hypothetical protein [Ignavibacteriota bacterium]